MSYYVGRFEEIPAKKPKVIELEGKSIGIVNQDGKLYAVRNICPHRLAPLCEGRVSGTMLPCDSQGYDFGMEGQVIRCPWHGWEFDLKTGEALFGTSNLKVTIYPVEVKDGEVYVSLKPIR